jgi:hypothetical protein
VAWSVAVFTKVALGCAEAGAGVARPGAQAASKRVVIKMKLTKRNLADMQFSLSHPDRTAQRTVFSEPKWFATAPLDRPQVHFTI